MSSRTFGQFCGLARALEIVGQRWALLIVRDLVLGPKRFSDLHRGLPRIPTNILAARLKELEQAGVVRRRALPRPAASVVYELTGYGRDLEDIVLRLGLWGARALGEPEPDDVVTADSLILALRATFRPEAAGSLRATYQIHVGDVVVHAAVDGGTLRTGEGPARDADLVPDLVLEAPATLHSLMSGELSASEATENSAVRVTGDQALVERFAEIFHVPPVPGPEATEPSDAARSA